MRPLNAAVALAALVTSLPASAAVTLYGTRIVYEAGQASISVKATNQGERAALTQAWLDHGNADATPAQQRVPFLVTPAVRRLEPGQDQTYRISHVTGAGPALPADRESLLYFNLLDIPPAVDAAEAGNTVQFALRTRVKLFYRPAALAGRAADAAAGLTWRIVQDTGTPALQVHNPGAYHVTFDGITLGDGTAVAADMIGPGATVRLPLPAGAAATALGTLAFGWLDDSGRTREQRATVAP